MIIKTSFECDDLAEKNAILFDKNSALKAEIAKLGLSLSVKK